MNQAAKVLFIWDQLGRVGGVETFLYQCLKWLPNYGLAPHVLELRHLQGSQSLQYAAFKDRIIEPRQREPSAVLAEIVRLGVKLIVLNSWEYSHILTAPLHDAKIPVIVIVHNDRDVFYENARLLYD